MSALERAQMVQDSFCHESTPRVLLLDGLSSKIVEGEGQNGLYILRFRRVYDFSFPGVDLERPSIDFEMTSVHC